MVPAAAKRMHGTFHDVLSDILHVYILHVHLPYAVVIRQVELL